MRIEKQGLRIALGGISLESNDFVPFSAELTDFADAGFLCEGRAVLDLSGSNTEIAGALERLTLEQDVEIVPLLAARGVSSGRLSERAWQHLRTNILAALASASAVDGVYLFTHGSMEAVGEDDPEGDLAFAIRGIVGENVALVLSCDLHANVSARMVEASDAILGYETYPHTDAKRTGARAVDLLLRTVRGEVTPTMAQAKIPLLLTAFNSTTLTDTPYAQLMNKAKALERQSEVLSASVFLVGSYIDAPAVGCSTLVITDGNPGRALAEAGRLADAFWQRRVDFEVETVSVAEAVERGRAIDGGPVLLLDTADTTGGGAAGDGIGLVHGLLEAYLTESALAQVVDADAAAACHQAGVGSEIEIEVGHKRDPRWGNPLLLRGYVERLSDGRFTYSGGILGGVRVTMGPSAVLAIGPVRLLVMSNPTYDWSSDQYRAVGLDPAAAKFVGVKNMMNFRFGYGDVMKAFYVLDLPGPTPPEMRQLPFERISRPTFPIDRDLDDPTPVFTSSRSRHIRPIPAEEHR